MSAGRTSWWPCDASEHDRELVVELGDEFGPAAHAVTRVLKDLAQQQRDGGQVRTGFRVVAAKCHLAVGSDAASARALARAIVERAGAIGWADDLVIDDDGRRFTCRVSGWDADQARGREAIKKANQRAAAPPKGHVPGDGDTPPGPPDSSPPEGTGAAVVPPQGDVSRCVPPTRDDQTEPEHTAAAARARPRGAEHIEAALAVIASRNGIAVPKPDDVDAVLADHPDVDEAHALTELQRWAQRKCPTNLVGALRRVLSESPLRPAHERRVAVDDATDDDITVWEAARVRLRETCGDGRFDVWIDPVRLAGRAGDELVLEAPPEIASWLTERFVDLITQALDGRAFRVVVEQEARAA